MKKIIVALLIILVTKVSYSIQSDEIVANTIIAKVKPTFRSYCTNNSIELDELQTLIIEFEIKYLKKTFPNHNAPSPVEWRNNPELVDLSLIYEFTISEKYSINKIIAQLKRTNYFEYVEPRFVYQLTYTPNDTDIAQQYHHAKLNTYAAWNVSKGDSNVVIGISDTGFDLSHIDLKDSYKKNYNDPIDGLDNDNDGYIDNYNGWDLANNDNNPTPEACAVCNHGVHVSGISSATTNNVTGIAGTGFQCKYLPLKIANKAGNLVKEYESIVYGADHNCKIINCSWGGYSGGQFGQDAINYATYNKNSLVIAGAGNFSKNDLFYPAAYDNVLSIAATDSFDVKWSNSNYGIFVDACAPGKDILSTWPGNYFVPSSGTSMACPAVAGCAAIVASYFPNYTALQIAEKIKNTCDNIDTIKGNSLFKNQLGSGRVNLLRALTDSNKSAMVITSKKIIDGNDNAITNGDTILIKCKFKNYLASTKKLRATIRTNSMFITLLDSVVTLGNIGSLKDTSNFLNPFKLIINANCPDNYNELFSIVFEDSNYVRKEYFTLKINVDYINLLENNLGISITSRSLIGYNESSQTEGIGITYNGNSSMLYESGLMIGDSLTRVSDCIRSAASKFDTDFSSQIKVKRIIPSAFADAEIDGVFNDDGAGNKKLNISVHQQTYAWSSSGNSNYVIIKYIIKNKNTDTLKNMYAGIFADWDIMNFNKNRTKHNAQLKLSYAFTTETNPLFAAIKLLSKTPFKHYAIDNITGANGQINLADGFSTAEKYTTLSSSKDSAGYTKNTGNDIIDVVATGPVNIAANDSTEIAFALIGGLSEQEIIDGAIAAQKKYDGILTMQKSTNLNFGVSIYPNPCNKCFVSTPTFELGKTSIQLISLDGKLVYKKDLSSSNEIINTFGLDFGLYLTITTIGTKVYYNKLLIANDNF